MSTYIHGIGASENIDSSGEIVSIAGLDVSSLAFDGTFNWEHKADTPAQVVGKVLKARKIFSDADCEDDHQLYFWNKVKVPYLYVMGELMDDYKDSAREVAGQFRYDADRRGKQKSTANFSVEGSKISKEGITVTRSIARKITITTLECNKAAAAEMVATKTPNPKKNEIDELFKTESVEIEIFTPSSNWNLLKKEDPKKHADKLGIKPFQKDLGGGQKTDTASTGLSGTGSTSAGGILGGEGMMRSEEMNKAANLSIVKPHQRGPKIGTTSSGKEVHSHGMIGDYKGFSTNDHHEAAGFHQKMAQKLSPTDDKSATHHGQKYTLHMQAAKSTARKMAKSVAAEDYLNKAVGEKGVHQQGSATQRGTSMAGVLARTKGSKSLQVDAHKRRLGELKAMPKPSLPKSEEGMAKALEAGSGMASPANLAGGAALASESIGGGVKKKSKLLQRAELEYTTWTKREEFETFMKSRMPGLTKGEIQVIGQTMLLQKSLKQEKALAKVAPSEFQHSWINKKEKLKKTADATKTTEDPTEEAAKAAQNALTNLPRKLK